MELPSLHGVGLCELESVCRRFDALLAFPWRGKNREKQGWGGVVTSKPSKGGEGEAPEGLVEVIGSRQASDLRHLRRWLR